MSFRPLVTFLTSTNRRRYTRWTPVTSSMLVEAGMLEPVVLLGDLPEWRPEFADQAGGIGARRCGAQRALPATGTPLRGGRGDVECRARHEQFTGNRRRLPSADQTRTTSGFHRSEAFSKRSGLFGPPSASSSAQLCHVPNLSAVHGLDACAVRNSGAAQGPRSCIEHENTGVFLSIGHRCAENQRSAGAVIRSGQVNAAEPVLQSTVKRWVWPSRQTSMSLFLAGAVAVDPFQEHRQGRGGAPSTARMTSPSCRPASAAPPPSR